MHLSKIGALLPIQQIASSLNNPQDGVVKKTVKQAMRILRDIITNALPPTASMVTICNQLPELINEIFN